MRQFFARLAISIAAVLIALVAAFVAMGFFAFALYQFILLYMQPAFAALATGVTILIAAMLLVFATKFAGRKPKRSKLADDPSLAAAESAAQLGGILGQQLRGFAETHGSQTLWGALIGGFVVGASPKLRAFLLSLLKP